MTLALHITSPTEALGIRGRSRSPGRLLVAIALSLLALGGLGWAAFAPIQLASREELFEIPHGTWARRMAGPVSTGPERRRVRTEREARGSG